MPQIQILPGNPGFGTQLGQALGSGFSTGVQQGISSRLNQMLERKKEFGKIDKATQAAYGKDWPVDPEEQLAAIKRSREYFNQGYSLPDSVLQSRFHEQLQEMQRPPGEKEQPSNALKPGEKQTFAGKFGGGKDTIAETKKIGQKIAYPFVQLYDTIREQFSPNAAAEQDLTREGYTPEQIQSLYTNEEYQKSLPAALRGGAPEPVTPKYLETTGGVGPGENIAERAGQNYLIGGLPGVVGGLLGEGADLVNAPTPVKEAAEVIGFLATIASGKIKGSARKANQKILTNAEKTAANTGRSVEEVIAEARKDSGANLEKALQGDAKEINKLNRSITNETPKVAEKVKETPKTVFNKETAIKNREAVGEKIKESPYEAYYKVEAEKAAKEAGKKAETRAKEGEVTERVKPLEEAKTKELKTQRSQLADLEKDAKKATGEAKSRIESSIGFKQREIQKTLDELRDLRHELRHFEKRPTDTQIEARARKSAEEFVAEAKNPTEGGQKGIKRQLELDKDFLERSDKLIARGEIPGDVRPDTFLRMKEKYLEGYNAMIKELREANKALQGARDAESLKTIADNKNAISYLEGRNRRLKADIVNQKDKIKALKAVEGPSGAFYRQQLKSVQKDVAQFQHDAIKVPKVKAPSQMKAEKVGQKELNEIGRAASEARKNPTPENLEKVAEKAGVPKEDFKKALEETKDLVKEGKSEKEIVSSAGEKIDDLVKKAETRVTKKLIKRGLTATLLYKAAILSLTGGEFHTFGQLATEYKRRKDVEKYHKAKDPTERHRVLNEFVAKGYTQAKIRNIRNAAYAKQKSEKK